MSFFSSSNQGSEDSRRELFVNARQFDDEDVPQAEQSVERQR